MRTEMGPEVYCSHIPISWSSLLKVIIHSIGESVFGPKFNDENLTKRFTHRGQVAMANSGPNTNGELLVLSFSLYILFLYV